MPATFSRAFMNGSPQAVRIPQELRLETSRVENLRNADDAQFYINERFA